MAVATADVAFFEADGHDAVEYGNHLQRTHRRVCGPVRCLCQTEPIMPEGDKTSLKLKLLDVEAELSCAAAKLSLTPPNVAAALVHLEAARQALLDMAEREELIEKAPLN